MDYLNVMEAVDFHHVIEAAGVVVFGLVFYSYTFRWFPPRGRLDPRWRPVITGLAFGVLAVVLMISRIRVHEDLFVDARAIPVALIALIEGWWAGLLAAILAGAYRVWLGGTGAPAGLAGILVTVATATLVRAWARRAGRLRAHHALVLAGGVFVVTFLSFLLLGSRGLRLFAPLALPFLVMSVVGLVFGALLFRDIVESQAAERARRDAAELRAVTSLARAAAHEINNPLMIVTGGLAILGKRLTAGSEEAKWAERAKDGAERIREIVAHMNEITQVQEAREQGLLPPMLDIRKSSELR
jgi:signal transduction histidine kinase